MAMADGIGTAGEVFLAFLKLGLTSFGGPVAHLGYFRAELIERRRWASEPVFAEIVSLCQFLPGPSSSQTGVALGLLRAGAWGGLAAWVGFTLPSAMLMTAFAESAAALPASRLGAALLHGVKLVAVAIVANALWQMARALCPDWPRAAIAAGAAVIVVAVPASAGQIAGILLGALAGLALCRADGQRPASAPMSVPIPAWVGAACLISFGVLLLVSPWLGAPEFGAFYRAGALVFGGGHVVLPLLHDALVRPGWVSDDAFLTGYGAAQALPGPLFSVAAYLGAVMRPQAGGSLGAALALLAIFLPGFLLLGGVLPFWTRLRAHPAVPPAMRGINAAVVGLLAAALYDPLWLSAVFRVSDLLLVGIGFLLLTRWNVQPLAVVALITFGSVVVAGLG